MNIKQFHMKLLWAIIHPELFLLPYVKKRSELKLIIRAKKYNILNNTMNGFYDSPIIMAVNDLKYYIGFVILDSNNNIVYNFKDQESLSTNEIILRLNAGEYYIKFLFSKQFGIAGEETQKIIVDGETFFDINLYTRHFKTVSVIDDCEVYDGYGIQNIYYPSGTNEVCVKNVSKMAIYELKWNKWVKIIEYNTVTENSLPVIWPSFELVPGRGPGGATVTYINGYVLSRIGKAYDMSGTIKQFNDTNIIGYVFDNTKLLNNIKYNISVTDSNSIKFLCQSYNHLSETTQTYNDNSSPILAHFRMQTDRLNSAMELYQNKKEYIDINSLDSEFFEKYLGKVLIKLDYGANVNISYMVSGTFSSYTNYINSTGYTPIKQYLPTITFIDNNFRKEREKDKQFWPKNTSLFNHVYVYEDDTVKSYNHGIMIFDGLSVTDIGTNNGELSWYSDDYYEYLQEI